MDDIHETIWITKYALTDGIKEVPLLRRDDDGYVKVKWSNTGWNDGEQLFHGRDHHDTKAAAIARAEEMRKAKIVSHQKSIAKLQAMKFS